MFRCFGIEGTGSYGAGLAGFLRRGGHRVVEVNRGDRRARRNNGKSDSGDAEAAARAVLSGQASAVPKSADGVVEMIPPAQGRPRHRPQGQDRRDRHAQGNGHQRARAAA